MKILRLPNAAKSFAQGKSLTKRSETLRLAGLNLLHYDNKMSNFPFILF